MNLIIEQNVGRMRERKGGEGEEKRIRIRLLLQ